MPANPSNSNIVIDWTRTSAYAFRATDRTNPSHFIQGAVTAGVLKFTVLARTPGKASGVSGSDFFAALMAHFGPGNVRGIRGHWVAGIGLDANIDQFNDLTGRGFSDEDAAAETWTGRRAAEYQFARAVIEFKDPTGSSPGQYFEVVALFTR